MLALGAPKTWGFVALTLACSVAWTGSARAQAVPPISQTLIPEGHVAVGVHPQILVGDGLDETNRWTQLASSFLPTVQVGVTDKLQLGALPLGVAYRVDEPFGMRGFEVIPAATVSPGLSHTNLSGFGMSYTVQLSLDVRQWINRKGAITLGGGGGSPISYQSGSGNCPDGATFCSERLSVFEYWFFAGTGGVTQTVGRFTFAIGATLAYSMRFGTATPSTSVFTIGSRVRHGILSDPLVRFHATDALSFDAHAQYTRYTAEAAGFGTMSVGVNYVF